MQIRKKKAFLCIDSCTCCLSFKSMVVMVALLVLVVQIAMVDREQSAEVGLQEGLKPANPRKMRKGKRNKRKGKDGHSHKKSESESEDQSKPKSKSKSKRAHTRDRESDRESQHEHKNQHEVEPKPKAKQGKEKEPEPQIESQDEGDEPSEEDGSADKEEEGQSGDESEDDDYFKDENAELVNWDYYPKLKQVVKDPAFTFDQSKCDEYLKLDTSPPKPRSPTHTACNDYAGVLHIQHFDQGGASGTIFFQFMVGFLQWADQHNYLPWIHMDDGYTKPIWDPVVHTQGPNNRTFQGMAGMEVGWARDKRDPKNNIFPGKPIQKHELHKKTYKLKGTGVWEHYFMPPNDFVPGDKSCEGKPFVKFNDDHIVPGMHSNAPWAPRAWRFSDIKYIFKNDIPLDEWFEPQRRHAAETVKRYIRFNPMMERRVSCIFPNSKFSLGMHIRHGDKWIEREVIPPATFLRYAKAFVENGGGSIFVATDSALVIEEIMGKWPKHVADRVVRQPAVAGLSRNGTAAFDIGVSSHRTNVEALTDLVALSKCTFLLHGLSALSEAALYMSPELVDRSINLEDEDQHYKDVKYFVEKMIPLAKRSKDNRRRILYGEP